jgi:uncharacterized protein (TIGR02145 family)
LVTGQETSWKDIYTPAYCWYNNDAPTYKDTYGALYNWFTVDVLSNGGKNVCPAGWHVPTDAEWTTLTTYLGGESIAGGKLKEEGTTHWNSPNIGATNETGFTALPAGSHHASADTFNWIGIDNRLWSSTEEDTTSVWSRWIHNEQSIVERRTNLKHNGYSVRCIKDN